MKTLRITNGDLVTDARTGRFTTVERSDKARQDVRNNLGKEVGYQGDGCGLDSLCGTMPSSPEAFRAAIQRAVLDGFRALIALQDRYQSNQRTAEERIVSVGAVYVQAVANVPTAYTFKVEVRTQAGPAIAVGGRLTTPQA